MPDLDLVAADGALRVFTLLHEAGRCCSTLVTRRLRHPRMGGPGPVDRRQIRWTWELPALGRLPLQSPLIRPTDMWPGWRSDQLGLADALTTWFDRPMWRSGGRLPRSFCAEAINVIRYRRRLCDSSG